MTVDNEHHKTLDHELVYNQIGTWLGTQITSGIMCLASRFDTLMMRLELVRACARWPKLRLGNGLA